jgi:hypothetical protein
MVDEKDLMILRLRRQLIETQLANMTFQQRALMIELQAIAKELEKHDGDPASTGLLATEQSNGTQ